MKLDSKWGFINKSGDLVIKNTFPEFADDFDEGLAVVDDPVRGAKIYVDATGRYRFFKDPTANATCYEGLKPLMFGSPIYVSEKCWLDLYSDPPGADVYLIPQFIWQFGGQGLPPPRDLPDSEMLLYLNSNGNFHVQEDRTHVRTQVREENFEGIFVRQGKIAKTFVTVHFGDNSAKVSFENQ